MVFNYIIYLDEKLNPHLNEREKDLIQLKESLKDKAPIGSLIDLCKTIDQAKCLLTMVDSISEKLGKATVSITAGRGRVMNILIIG